MNADTLELASKIAELVIDKSFWGNKWFLIFFVMLVSLIVSLCAFAGAYFKTRGQNKALKADFDSLISRLETQTQAVKKIEESIAHDFWEKRESLKIKREKLEEAYESLSNEVNQIGKNISEAMADLRRNIVWPSEKVKTIISLYFNDEMEDTLQEYIDARNNCLSFLKEISESNYNINDQQVSMFNNSLKEDQCKKLMHSLGLAKDKIEKSLQIKMKKLTNSSS